ncbi:MAG: carbon-nitrogen hydrolase family protein [Candidatus Bathyarchaeota archaeon]|nr:MAG: carbon-nitrogen hydrolase family protein [Candidatus Bathyarchaeota archaeon]
MNLKPIINAYERNSVKIALVQQHVTRKRDENLTRGLEALETAASHDAKLVAFPELSFSFFLPQYPCTSSCVDYAEPIPGPTTELFSRKARDLQVVIVLNLYEREGSNAFDTSPVINADGEIVGKTRMIHIVDAPGFREKGYYTPGDLGAGVFDTAVGRVGVAICYDRHFPEYMRALALKGAELVIVPQAGAVNEWPLGIFEAELQVAAFQNGYFTALVNRVGKEEEVTFAGESFVTDPEGRIIAKASKGKDQILYADIDLRQVRNSPAQKHFLSDRRPYIYKSL